MSRHVTIHSTCALCGDVDLTVDDITLELSLHGSTYTFDHNGHVNRRNANGEVIRVLRAVDVTTVLASDDEEWIAALPTVRDLEELEMT